jgi:membrane-associated phospholipid phosphatase
MRAALNVLRARLRPEEALFGLYGLVLLAIWRWAHMAHFTETLHWPFLVVVAVVAVARAVREPDRWGGAMLQTLRDFVPFLAVILLYETLHDLTPVLRPQTVDDRLAALDRRLFGRDLALWMTGWATPWLTRVMVFCYASYFFAAPILAGLLYLGERGPAFRRLMLGVSLATLLGILGYLAVPAVGPYIYQAALFPGRLPGATAGTHYVVAAIDAAKGAARDCFPSLHTAHTTVVLLATRAFRRSLFWAFLPIALGLYVSTIYLRMHYAVDVAAGLAVAGTAWWLAPRLDRFWRGRHPGPPSSISEGSDRWESLPR